MSEFVFTEKFGNCIFKFQSLFCKYQNITNPTLSMRYILLLVLLLISGICSFSQSIYNDIRLESTGDYKLAEPYVLKAANYLFTTKYDKDDLERLYAIEFIMKWMGGTPDFTFEVDENFTKPFLSETDLLGLYMSAVAKFALEHKAQANDAKTINLGAAKMIVEYSNKPSNNLKQTGELKKMATAFKKGELEKYFGI